jgi:hypothetical protein
MHHFIYATKDSWISSGSNHTTGETETDQNFGQDQILEIKKNFWNKDFDYQTRALVQFDLTDLSSSLVNGDILDSTATNSPRSASYYLRLYEAEGNQELSTEYKLAALPISESWDEGTGKFGANPKITTGISWDNRNYYPGSSEVNWSGSGVFHGESGGITVISGSTDASQSFSYQSSDIEMNVTTIVNNWLNGTNQNYGFLLRFSGSQETDSTTFGQLKFFSSQTHTIYPPKLEVRWDDHAIITGSATGSMTALTMSGAEDNYLYMKRFREKYRESEKVKFRIGARKRYIQKTFSTSVQTITGSYIPENSGSYSIVDVATGESIIPFSDYTKLSCDSTSNYFIQWLNGFAPDRVYKILLKLNGDDGQEQIFDEGFEFIVTR